MEGKGPEISATVIAVPQIMVTEPSPVINNTILTVQSATPTTEESSQQNKGETSTTVDAMRVSCFSRPLFSGEHEQSGEFAAAQLCNERVVPAPEESQSVEGTTTATSENDQDDFRTGTESGYSCCFQWVKYYKKVRNFMHSAYAIPVWLLLLALPISAGVMGALHMYSCPAGRSTTTLVFIIGISLMAVISFRVCFIIHRITFQNENENSINCLHTLMLVATFLTVIFFATESVAYWQMDSTSHPGTPKYCSPRFVTFAFWWNCLSFVVIVPILLVPA